MKKISPSGEVRNISTKEEHIFMLLCYSDEDLAMLLAQVSPVRVDKGFIDIFRYELFRHVRDLSAQEDIRCFMEEQARRTGSLH
ncbi:hypothetical protein JW796_00770 [Candidatus Dojkabacteria bacterium]|nr:hypothetical protein [Candidatus Dojkabacteria bacterium]